MKPSKTIELDCIWARSRLLLFGWSLKRTKNAGNEIGNFVQMAWKICVSWLWRMTGKLFPFFSIKFTNFNIYNRSTIWSISEAQKMLKKKDLNFQYFTFISSGDNFNVFQSFNFVYPWILFLDILSLIIWHVFLDIDIEARHVGQAKAGFQANVCILLHLKEVRTYRRSR